MYEEKTWGRRNATERELSSVVNAAYQKRESYWNRKSRQKNHQFRHGGDGNRLTGREEEKAARI